MVIKVMEGIAELQPNVSVGGWTPSTTSPPYATLIVANNEVAFGRARTHLGLRDCARYDIRPGAEWYRSMRTENEVRVFAIILNADDAMIKDDHFGIFGDGNMFHFIEDLYPRYFVSKDNDVKKMSYEFDIIMYSDDDLMYIAKDRTNESRRGHYIYPTSGGGTLTLDQPLSSLPEWKPVSRD